VRLGSMSSLAASPLAPLMVLILFSNYETSEHRQKDSTTVSLIYWNLGDDALRCAKKRSLVGNTIEKHFAFFLSLVGFSLTLG